MKKLSKKHYLIISGSIIALSLVLVVVTGVKAATDKQPDMMYREYPVSRGNITAGLNSVGSVSLNTIKHKFETDVMIDEVFIKQGQVVKKGDPIASLLTTEIEEKIKELEASLVAANLSLDQAKNNKTITVLNQENGWKATTDQSKEQYETEKSEAQKNIQSLENRVKDLQDQINQKNEEIKNLTDLIQQEQDKPEEQQPHVDEEQKNSPEEDNLLEEKDNQLIEGQLQVETEEERPEIAEEQSIDPLLTKNQSGTLAVDESNQINNDQTRSVLTDLESQLSQVTEQRDQLVSQLNDVTTQLNEAKQVLERVEANRKKVVEKEKKQQEDNKKVNSLSVENQEGPITIAQKEVDRLKEEISKVKEQLNNPILYAQVDGIVLELGFLPNTQALVDGSGAKIGTTDKITAVMSVSQTDIHQIELGQKVRLDLPAYEGDEFTGTVSFRDLTSKNEGGSIVYKVTVDIDPTDYELLDGMSAEAEFIIKEVTDVIMLSNKAIILEDGKQMVKVKQEDGSIKDVMIKTGFSDGRQSEILEGLNEGDVVVVEG